MQRIYHVVSKFLLLCGIITLSGFLYLQFEKSKRYNPAQVSFDSKLFAIETIEEGEGIWFIIKDDQGGVADSSLGGSVDLVCAPPFIILYDMNQDGKDDLYLHECGGHGYLAYNSTSEKFEYVNLGQWDPSDIRLRMSSYFIHYGPIGSYREGF